MSDIKKEEIRKPYSCKLSTQFPGVDILCDGKPILFVPMAMVAIELHNKIVNSLNESYLMGYLERIYGRKI